MNLPLELIDKILQYDGRITYRKGEFVNVIHKKDSRYSIVDKVIKKKQNILKNIDAGPIEFDLDFEFDGLPGVGLAISLDLGDRYHPPKFIIVYFDCNKADQFNHPFQIFTYIPLE